MNQTIHFAVNCLVCLLITLILYYNVRLSVILYRYGDYTVNKQYQNINNLIFCFKPAGVLSSFPSSLLAPFGHKHKNTLANSQRIGIKKERKKVKTVASYSCNCHHGSRNKSSQPGLIT